MMLLFGVVSYKDASGASGVKWFLYTTSSAVFILYLKIAMTRKLRFNER